MTLFAAGSAQAAEVTTSNHAPAGRCLGTTCTYRNKVGGLLGPTLDQVRVERSSSTNPPLGTCMNGGRAAILQLSPTVFAQHLARLQNATLGFTVRCDVDTGTVTHVSFKPLDIALSVTPSGGGANLSFVLANPPAGARYDILRDGNLIASSLSTTTYFDAIGDTLTYVYEVRLSGSAIVASNQAGYNVNGYAAGLTITVMTTGFTASWSGNPRAAFNLYVSEQLAGPYRIVATTTPCTSCTASVTSVDPTADYVWDTGVPYFFYVGTTADSTPRNVRQATHTRPSPARSLYAVQNDVLTRIDEKNGRSYSVSTGISATTLAVASPTELAYIMNGQLYLLDVVDESSVPVGSTAWGANAVVATRDPSAGVIWVIASTGAYYVNTRDGSQLLRTTDRGTLRTTITSSPSAVYMADGIGGLRRIRTDAISTLLLPGGEFQSATSIAYADGFVFLTNSFGRFSSYRLLTHATTFLSASWANNARLATLGNELYVISAGQLYLLNTSTGVGTARGAVADATVLIGL